MAKLKDNNEEKGKKEALKSALAMIEKQFWTGSIMKMDSKSTKVETYSSWSIILDEYLGWGYGKWRIVELYWAESSWKTMLTLLAIAECQRQGWTVAFVDAEYAFSKEYAINLWVNVDNLIVSQPDCWEQALEIVDALTRSWAVNMIVVDSVAALTPKSEIEWNMWDSQMWVQARLMSQGLRKITWAVSKSNTTVIFINQTRMKIWVMFWNPMTTTWWNALKFYASQRIEINKKWKIEEWKWDDATLVGIQSKVKVVKNKIAPPFKEWIIDLYFKWWFSKEWEILDIWEKKWVITKKWAFYYFWEEKLWQGRENAKSFLVENHKVFDKIMKDIDKINSDNG